MIKIRNSLPALHAKSSFNIQKMFLHFINSLESFSWCQTNHLNAIIRNYWIENLPVNLGLKKKNKYYYDSYCTLKIHAAYYSRFWLEHWQINYPFSRNSKSTYTKWWILKLGGSETDLMGQRKWLWFNQFWKIKIKINPLRKIQNVDKNKNNHRC